MTIRARLYQNETDYAQMRTLVQRLTRLEKPATYCMLGDLDWWRFTDSNIYEAKLWFDDQKLVGIAWPNDEQVDVMLEPNYAYLLAEMTSWAEQKRRESSTEEPLSIIGWAYEHDKTRQAVLAQLGYHQTETHLVTYCRDLTSTIGEAVLPEGYSCRPFAGESEIEERVALHRNAFAPSKMSVARQRAVMSSPTYQLDLDLLVIAPDQSMAAFCIIWYDEINGLGTFEPVGCHADHRQKGLTKALLLEGFQRLKALTATAAWVTAAAETKNAAANRLYASAGFQVAGRNYRWEKQLT